MVENYDEAVQYISQLSAVRASEVRARYPDELTLADIQDMLVDASVLLHLVSVAVAIGGSQDAS